MTYYKESGQMDLSDRVAIETGIGNKESFKKIGKLIGSHPSTIAQKKSVSIRRARIKRTSRGCVPVGAGAFT